MDKVLKGLIKCTDDTCAMEECPYYEPGKYCMNKLHADAINLILKLKKENEHAHKKS